MFFSKYIIFIAFFIMVHSYSLTDPSGTDPSGTDPSGTELFSSDSLREVSSSDKIMSDSFIDPDYYMVNSCTQTESLVENQFLNEFLNDEEIMKYLYV